MPRKFYLTTSLLTILQLSFLLIAAAYMFKVKNYNQMLLKEITYLEKKMEKDLLALNVRKTEYSLLSSPYSLTKLTNLYLNKGKRGYSHDRHNFRKLSQAALVLNPYGKAIAQLP